MLIEMHNNIYVFSSRLCHYAHILVEILCISRRDSYKICVGSGKFLRRPLTFMGARVIICGLNSQDLEGFIGIYKVI